MYATTKFAYATTKFVGTNFVKKISITSKNKQIYVKTIFFLKRKIKCDNPK